MMRSKALQWLSRQATQLYWSLTNSVGLQRIHGQERRLLYKYTAENALIQMIGAPLVRLFERATGRRIIVADWICIALVGHLALDFDCLIKLLYLRGETRKPLVITVTSAAANPALLSLWKQYVYFVYSPWLAQAIAYVRSKSHDPNLSLKKFGAAMHGASEAHRVQSAWAGRSPLLELPADIQRMGTETLRAMGLPEGSWFVCLHNREAGYSPQFEVTNDFRNSDIRAFDAAIAAIAARGGFTIRMGDASMTPLPPLPNAIDYARSAFKSDWMDLYLCAACRFFVGTTSGLYCVAGVFGRPIVQVNLTPFGCLYSQFPGSIGIPKLVKTSDGRFMSFGELGSDPASTYLTTRDFIHRSLTNVDNSPTDISEVVVEMLDRLDGKAVSTAPESDVRQARLRQLFTESHYSFHSCASAGSAFLSRHQDLLSRRDA